MLTNDAFHRKGLCYLETVYNQHNNERSYFDFRYGGLELNWALDGLSVSAKSNLKITINERNLLSGHKFRYNSPLVADRLQRLGA